MTPRRATKGEWAEKKARNGVQYISCLTNNEVYGLIAKLLKAEHARAVRIVKAEIKRVMLDQHHYNKLDKEVRLEELNTVLTKLTRGR